MYQNPWAVTMGQLANQSLLTQEDSGSNYIPPDAVDREGLEVQEGGRVRGHLQPIL